jgi:hypothetical protein
MRDPNSDRNPMRTMVRGAYDLQKLRIQMGNRLAANFHAKTDEDSEEKKEAVVAQVKRDYKKLADALAARGGARDFEGEGVIGSYAEFCLVSQYVTLEKAERSAFKQIEGVLEEFPIYREFLNGVRGVGPAMGGVIVSELDPAKARYPSSFWKYAGLDVGPDGRGRGRYKEHLVKVKYLNAKGEEKERNSVTFNPFLKTKLLGVLGPCFLRSDSSYRKVYDDQKHRLENHPRWGKARDGEKEEHGIVRQKWRHDRAIRYMVKFFLADLWREWRMIEGLPVTDDYATAKLGLNHQRAA